MATRQSTVLALTMLLTGCSTALPSQKLTSFPTTGQDTAQMQRDAVECDAIAAGKSENVATAFWLAGAIGAGIAHSQNQKKEEAIYRACMQARGYTTQEVR